MSNVDMDDLNRLSTGQLLALRFVSKKSPEKAKEMAESFIHEVYVQDTIKQMKAAIPKLRGH
jgi:hypothetical protein